MDDLGDKPSLVARTPSRDPEPTMGTQMATVNLVHIVGNESKNSFTPWKFEMATLSANVANQLNEQQVRCARLKRVAAANARDWIPLTDVTDKLADLQTQIDTIKTKPRTQEDDMSKTMVVDGFAGFATAWIPPTCYRTPVRKTKHHECAKIRSPIREINEIPWGVVRKPCIHICFRHRSGNLEEWRP